MTWFDGFEVFNRFRYAVNPDNGYWLSRTNKLIEDLIIKELDLIKTTRENFQRTDDANWDELELHSLESAEEHVPLIIRKSHFLIQFAENEKNLKKLCHEVKSQFKLPYKFEDLRGNFLDAFETYLEGVEFDFNEFEDSWSRLKKYSNLRNKIIHEGGFLNEQLWKNLESLGSFGLSRDQDGYCQLSREFNSNFSKLLNELKELITNQLMSLLDKKLKEEAETTDDQGE